MQWDLQAMARVHRIGQKRPVHVYRFCTAGSVEQRVQQRAEKKLYLDQMVNRGSQAGVCARGTPHGPLLPPVRPRAIGHAAAAAAQAPLSESCCSPGNAAWRCGWEAPPRAAHAPLAAAVWYMRVLCSDQAPAGSAQAGCVLHCLSRS